MAEFPGQALLAAALLLGLGGVPHCAAMCGAPCSAIGAAGRTHAAFLAGRLCGYALAGAVAAGAAGALGQAASQARALQPLMTLVQLSVLGWGLWLLLLAREPAWAASAGRRLWDRVRPSAGRGAFAMGAAWVFMPCGLLWSALLLAALAPGPAGGAATMGVFALASMPGLVGGPWLLRRLRLLAARLGAGWGVRASGGLLVMAAALALWLQTVHAIRAWCA